MQAGRFITFEGGEGAGKSTQLKRLAETLRERGREVVTTREPGGSPGAEQIRSLLVSGEPDRWDGMTEALLHFAARRDHLRATVWPALKAGKWVLCDRFADSTLAYQGYGRGLPIADLQALQRVALGDFAPDLTLILDLPVAEGFARAAGRAGSADRFERLDPDFHELLRQGFLRIAADHPGRCVLIDASGDIESVHGAVIAAIAGRLRVNLAP